MKKVALLIGVSNYQPGLNPLPSAEQDVRELQRVLQNPEIGGFDEVTPLLNPDLMKMQEAIEALFRERERDDLILLFFSGHGIKDDAGKLYLATSVTQKTPRGELVKASAVPATFVYEILNNSRSKRQVVMLDCCFSGAFAEGMIAKDDGRVGVLEQLGGEGRAVLTSSTSTQYSFEQQGSKLSIYTRYIIEGLETGAADEDNDGLITIDELHTYAKRRVQESAPAMKPEIQTDKEGFRIRLAKALLGDPRLRYRKEVAHFADRGELSDIALDALDARRQGLGLTVEEAEAIQNEVLKPSRIYHQNLKRFERHYRDALQREFPLSPSIQDDLNYLQTSLALRDQDVKPIILRLTNAINGQTPPLKPKDDPNKAAFDPAAPFDPVPLPLPVVPAEPPPAPKPPAPPPPPNPLLVAPLSPAPTQPIPARPLPLVTPQPAPRPSALSNPLMKGLLSAGLVIALSGLGLYGYRQWTLYFAGDEILQESISLASEQKWGEAIAHLNQLPPSSSNAEQARSYRNQWSHALWRQAQDSYTAGDVERAIAQAQAIPPDSAFYNQAQGAINQWRQEWESDQAILVEINKALEVWDINTPRQRLPQIHNERLRADADTHIRNVERQIQDTETQRQIAETQRRLKEAEAQAARQQLLNKGTPLELSRGYQYAWLAERSATEEDLAGKTEFELYVMRNSIYARHGRRFDDPDLTQAFSAESWYREVYSKAEFDQIADTLLNDQERTNFSIIRNYARRLATL